MRFRIGPAVMALAAVLASCQTSPDTEPTGMSETEAWPALEAMVAATLDGTTIAPDTAARSVRRYEDCESADQVRYVVGYRLLDLEAESAEDFLVGAERLWEELGYDTQVAEEVSGMGHRVTGVSPDGFTVAVSLTDRLGIEAESPCVDIDESGPACVEPLGEMDPRDDLVRDLCPDGYRD